MRGNALLEILRTNSPLVASGVQGECDKLPPGEPPPFVDLPPSLTHPPKLKKLIGQVVQELTLLGFSPEIVQDLIKQGNDAFNTMKDIPNLDERSAIVAQSHTTTNPGLKLRYEVANDLGRLAPRLRLVVSGGTNVDAMVSETDTRTAHC